MKKHQDTVLRVEKSEGELSREREGGRKQLCVHMGRIGGETETKLVAGFLLAQWTDWELLLLH